MRHSIRLTCPVQKLRAMLHNRKDDDDTSEKKRGALSHEPKSASTSTLPAISVLIQPNAPNPTDMTPVPNSPTSETPSTTSSAVDSFKSFTLQVTKDLWPEFSPGDGAMQAVGKLSFVFTDSSQGRWSRGEDTGTEFGCSVFSNQSPPSDTLPTRLFDLKENRVVLTNEIGRVYYVIISHVWGEVDEVDGSRYGVEWPIPIRSKAKLNQMLTAARVIGGMRYVWIDVLCLDQRTKNGPEIAKMGMYYGNASGCLVWLDSASNAKDWHGVLSSIEEVNEFFKTNKSGIPTIPVEDIMNDRIADMRLSGGEALRWVRKVLALEEAEWFRRVWTLQEAVIPDNICLCTPDRYMVSGGSLFQLVSLCGMVAKLLIDAGSVVGVAITHELQKSETWKILRLRQLYRKKQISYWHLLQATRTRKCKYAQDKIFGVSGMIHGRIPSIDYSRDLKDLYLDLYRSSLERREFGACCFLGNEGAPLMPDVDGMGLIVSRDPDQTETHRLSFDENGLHLDGVGIDPVRRVHVISTKGGLKAWSHTDFASLSTPDHIDIARAFEMPTDTFQSLCPGAFAAMSALEPLPPEVLTEFEKDFVEKYETSVPRGLLMWCKAGMLMQVTEDNAFVVIWTASSGPQLAVLTDRVEGKVIVVTPSSYVDRPGEGCMICRLSPTGTVEKIGVGMGRRIKASSKASLLVV